MIMLQQLSESMNRLVSSGVNDLTRVRVPAVSRSRTFVNPTVRNERASTTTIVSARGPAIAASTTHPLRTTHARTIALIHVREAVVLEFFEDTGRLTLL
jgi:hypothetical protein